MLSSAVRHARGRLLSSQSATYNHRPLRQAAKVERVLLEALSRGQSTHWHGPRVHVHGVEMTANLTVAKVLCEPFDEMTTRAANDPAGAPTRRQEKPKDP